MFPYYDWHYQTHLTQLAHPRGSNAPVPVVIRERVYDDPDPSSTWRSETEGLNGIVVKRHQPPTALGESTAMLDAYTGSAAGLKDYTAGIVYTMIDVDYGTHVVVETAEHNDPEMARYIQALWDEDIYVTETEVWDAHTQQWESDCDHIALLVGKSQVEAHFADMSQPK